MIAETTVARKGEHTISLKSTGDEKVLVSVCLVAKGDGTKLIPLVVFRGAKMEVAALNDEFKNKCVVETSTNSWMNEELTPKWIQQVLGTFSFGRRFRAWDSFECHIIDSVKTGLKILNVDQATVPGGCTKYIQAPELEKTHLNRGVLGSTAIGFKTVNINTPKLGALTVHLTAGEEMCQN